MPYTKVTSHYCYLLLFNLDFKTMKWTNSKCVNCILTINNKNNAKMQVSIRKTLKQTQGITRIIGKQIIKAAFNSLQMKAFSGYCL